MAMSYGLTADDWQEDELEGWLGRRANGRWAAATCGLAVPRQNGKNGCLEIRELYGMVELGERFLHTAHEVKTARKAFLRIASFFDNERAYPELAALVREIRRTNGQEAVWLTNGGSIEFISRSRSSGRGFTADVLVLDEAQELTDEELGALLPTISAAPSGNPQVLLTGTPPDPEKPTQGEVFARVRAEATANRDPRLFFSDYGATDGPLPDVDDRDLWFKHNPTLGNRLQIGEVEREHRLMSPEQFARERLGWWMDPAALSSVFGAGRWEACRGGRPEGLKLGALAVAVSFELTHACIAAAAMDGDMVHVRPLAHQPGTGWVIAMARHLQDTHGVDVVVDSKGPGADLIPAFVLAGIRVKVTDTADVLDACAELFKRAQDGLVKHDSFPELDKAVAGAVKRTVGDRWAWGRKVSTADISPLEAVTLASWWAANGNSLPAIY